jgi:hypothetical protein
MRDKRFIAVHKGGSLTETEHRLLMIWACNCAEHVLPYIGENIDGRLISALLVAWSWTDGKASVGEARKASVGTHAFARESTDPVVIPIARAVGHAVATAHMADHSLGSALYALKAIRSLGKSIEEERLWQLDKLPSEIRDIVVAGLAEKEKHFKF